MGKADDVGDLACTGVINTRDTIPKLHGPMQHDYCAFRRARARVVDPTHEGSQGRKNSMRDSFIGAAFAGAAGVHRTIKSVSQREKSESLPGGAGETGVDLSSPLASNVMATASQRGFGRDRLESVATRGAFVPASQGGIGVADDQVGSGESVLSLEQLQRLVKEAAFRLGVGPDPSPERDAPGGILSPDDGSGDAAESADALVKQRADEAAAAAKAARIPGEMHYLTAAAIVVAALAAARWCLLRVPVLGGLVWTLTAPIAAPVGAVSAYVAARQTGPRADAAHLVTLVGLALGFGVSVSRNRNRAHAAAVRAALQCEPGYSYVKTVLGEMPAHVQMRADGDAAGWLTTFVGEIWDSISGLMSEAMGAYVEPVMDAYKPPGVNSMRFQRFTLGTRPPRFSSCRAIQFVRGARDHVALDMDFVFDSDAEIQLAVGVGKLTSVVVVSDVKLQATLRLLFKPLWDEAPCFKAVAVSFVGTPFFRCAVDGRGLPLPDAVLTYIGNTITEMILSWYAWPNRLLVPMTTTVSYYELEPKPRAVVLVRLMALRGFGAKAAAPVGRSSNSVEDGGLFGSEHEEGHSGHEHSTPTSKGARKKFGFGRKQRPSIAEEGPYSPDSGGPDDGEPPSRREPAEAKPSVNLSKKHRVSVFIRGAKREHSSARSFIAADGTASGDLEWRPTTTGGILSGTGSKALSGLKAARDVAKKAASSGAQTLASGRRHRASRIGESDEDDDGADRFDGDPDPAPDDEIEGETFALVVKEPDVESVLLVLEEVSDSLMGGSSVREVARYEVPLRDVIVDTPPGTDDHEVRYSVPMSTEAFGVEGGETLGRADVGLTLNDVHQGLDSDVGGVWIKIIDVRGVPKCDPGGAWAQPYFVVRVPDAGGRYPPLEGKGCSRAYPPAASRARWTTTPGCATDDRASCWIGAEHTFMGVPLRAAPGGPLLPAAPASAYAATGRDPPVLGDPSDRRCVRLDLFDRDAFGDDDPIGTLEIPLADVLSAGGCLCANLPFRGVADRGLQPNPARRKPFVGAFGAEGFPTEYRDHPTDRKLLECRLEVQLAVAWLGYH